MGSGSAFGSPKTFLVGAPKWQRAASACDDLLGFGFSLCGNVHHRLSGVEALAVLISAIYLEEAFLLCLQPPNPKSVSRSPRSSQG